ncbi:MAG: ribbon-helix-helix domain-containing protein [Candidatus Peribacteria bacterium]|jgi:metal-responsive CopG/Arc/MetJ family transcriptional regulator|nr:ribbon-helix-helix domain-containing protein [Candidatus Peribacteria bacterium]
MIKKEKITISLDSNLLAKIDERIDKLNFKSRSNVIENFVKEGLRLKNDIEALIIANDDNWND